MPWPSEIVPGVAAMSRSMTATTGVATDRRRFDSCIVTLST